MNTASNSAESLSDVDLAGRVEACLDQFLAQRQLPGSLVDAMRYVLGGGGKRLRPILAVRCCQAVGGSVDSAIPPAAAIELIHNFSLVHDDLPAMDDDDLRRGRPTLHRHTNEAMAVLAGDAMIGLAFELLTELVEPAELATQLCRELASATCDMIAGQVHDTLGDLDSAMQPRQRLEKTHRLKTGALIRCACRLGAITGGANDAQLNAVTAFAEPIGLMYQIVDDLLDVTSTAEQLGKATGKDADKGKLTYPGLLGVEASRRLVQDLRARADNALDDLGDVTALRHLCDYMASRSS